jgi:hypothetical protein
MARCITCGTELHPERALKYNYCMAPQCQEKNAKGLTMVAVGMNKAADELLILDERTRQDLADGKYRDLRRAFAGPPDRLAEAGSAAPPTQARSAAPSIRARQAPAGTGRAGQPARRVQPRPRRAWTASQERLALLYNDQGLRPAEIAAKLGVSSHLITQIILAARNRGKA